MNHISLELRIFKKINKIIFLMFFNNYVNFRNIIWESINWLRYTKQLFKIFISRRIVKIIFNQSS